MNRRVPFVAIVFVTLLSGCTRPAVDLEAEGEALMQLSRDWSDVAATNDLDAIMAGWAFVLPYRMPFAPFAFAKVAWQAREDSVRGIGP